MRDEEKVTPEPVPQPPMALCPHCRKPLTSVGWLTNDDAGVIMGRPVGLVTYYHNDLECMVALNLQMLPAAAQAVQMPGRGIEMLRPMGRG